MSDERTEPGAEPGVRPSDERTERTEPGAEPGVGPSAGSTEKTEPGVGPSAGSTEASAEDQRRLWREALLQEALDNRPELRSLTGKLDFAASQVRGRDQGFEAAARTLTPSQLQQFQALLDRRMTRYIRQEMPQDLQARLAEASLGMDEAGYLAGYVTGVGEFLQAYKGRIQREE